jgi:hypothetical protein
MSMMVDPILGGIPGATKRQRDLDTVTVGLGAGVLVLGKGVNFGPVYHVTLLLAASAAQEFCSVGEHSSARSKERKR